MIVIKDDVLHIRRGDSGELTVKIKVGGQEVAMDEGDTMTLTIRQEAKDDSPVVFSTVSDNNTIRIEAGDLSEIEPGKYSCDIQWNRSNGEVHTLFPKTTENEKPKNWKNFCIESEVTIDA